MFSQYFFKYVELTVRSEHHTTSMSNQHFLKYTQWSVELDDWFIISMTDLLFLWFIIMTGLLL